MKTIKDLLNEHPFFRDLSSRQIEILAGCGQNVHFQKGDLIIQEGGPANYFFIIRRGKVALEINGAERGAIRIQTIEEGDILGWSWLIPPHLWAFTGYAGEDVDAVALDGKCLRGKCDQDHDLGYALLKRFSGVLAERLKWARMQLLDIYGEMKVK